MCKQEAVTYIPHLGPQTAKKYQDRAIAEGLIIEAVDERDGRAKLLQLPPQLKEPLEAFFDHAVDSVRAAL